VNLLELFLGIMTALGGFVDIGELVFAMDTGARFAYQLLWVVVLGTVGIALFGEMSGRIAVVTHKPTFVLIRDRMGHGKALAVLVASNLVNLITCTAEVGGVAAVLRLLFGTNYRAMVAVSAALMIAIMYWLKFKWIERVFGLTGLLLLVYFWVAFAMQPDWAEAARGLAPSLPSGENKSLLYWYFAVGLFSSILMPYEVYFYSSGAIEDQWKVKDLPMNMLNAGVGFVLGGLLTMALIVVGAEVFFPRDIDPKVIGTPAIAAALAYGVPGLLIALLGALFAIMGAAVETALAGAYNLAQFFGKPWGKRKKPREVPAFTVMWMAMIATGCVVAMSGVNPVQFVEFSVIFAVVVLPFTYYPILRAASDRKAMGKHVNERWITALGWFYFVLIAAAAAAAIPLMWLTHMGEG
jgi:Mn2+/Fe2+ NRAMP family transporter